VDFGQPDDIQSPTLGCLYLREGLRESLVLRTGSGGQKLVENAEFHGLSPAHTSA